MAQLTPLPGYTKIRATKLLLLVDIFKIKD